MYVLCTASAAWIGLDVFSGPTEVSQTHLVPILAICMPKSIILELPDSHSLSTSLPSPLVLHCSLHTSRLSPAWLPLIDTLLYFDPYCIYCPVPLPLVPPFLLESKLILSHYTHPRRGHREALRPLKKRQFVSRLAHFCNRRSALGLSRAPKQIQHADQVNPGYSNRHMHVPDNRI